MPNATPAWLNVKNFGAFGDGQHDDWQAITDAFNASLVASPTLAGVAVVYFPPGTYRVTQPLKFPGSQYGHIRGDGPKISLLWLDAPGTSPSAILDLEGFSHGAARDFSLGCSATTTPTYGLWWHDGAAGIATTSLFENIRIDGEVTYGIYIGTPGSSAQTDQGTFVRCSANGGRSERAPDAPAEARWKAGFVVGSGVFGNNLAHNFFACAAHHFESGVILSASEMIWHGGLAQSNGADFLIATTGYCHISGIRTELSSRFIDTPPGGGNRSGFRFTVSDCEVRLAFDTKTIGVDSTVAAGSTTTSVQAANVNWQANLYANAVLRFLDGPNAGQSRVIASNTSNTLAFATPVGVVQLGSRFVVQWPVTGATTNTLTANGISWGADEVKYYAVRVFGGKGAGQRRIVTTNSAHTLTVDVPWTTIPDGTSVFGLTIAAEDGAWARYQQPGVFGMTSLIAINDLKTYVGTTPVIRMEPSVRRAHLRVSQLLVDNVERDRDAFTLLGASDVLIDGYMCLVNGALLSNAAYGGVLPTADGGTVLKP